MTTQLKAVDSAVVNVIDDTVNGTVNPPTIAELEALAPISAAGDTNAASKAFADVAATRPFRTMLNVSDLVINVGTTAKPDDASELVIGTDAYQVLAGETGIEKLVGGVGAGSGVKEKRFHALVRHLEGLDGIASVRIPSKLNDPDDQGFLTVKSYVGEATRAASELALAGALKLKRAGKTLVMKYTVERQILPSSVETMLGGTDGKPKAADLAFAHAYIGSFPKSGDGAFNPDSGDIARHAADIRDRANAWANVTAALGSVIVKRY